jgi:hypothetical protein
MIMRAVRVKICAENANGAKLFGRQPHAEPPLRADWGHLGEHHVGSQNRSSCAAARRGQRLSCRRQGSSGNNKLVSFDLYVFPPAGPRTVAEVFQLLDAEEQRLASRAGNPLPPPEPGMVRFLAELERRWPSLEDDPDGSPWSSWPLWEPMLGGGTALNISWSRADEMYEAILQIAARTRVIIYNPQIPEVVPPPD